MSIKIINSTDQGIGRTFASEKFLNTMDGFWFPLHPNVIINSFDLVTVDNLFDSNTIGIVKELQAVAEDEYKDYFSDYQKLSTTKEQLKEKKDKDQERNLPLSKTQLIRVVVAKVAIMANTGIKAPGYKKKKNISINFPVGVGKTVRFATEEEIIFALGMPQMENPIPAGIIDTTNGLEVPFTLDVTYLAGADTVHVNASGISGNRKRLLYFILITIIISNT